MLFRRSEIQADLDEEIRSHLEMQQEDHRANGMTVDEARREALRNFGHAAGIKEKYRDRYHYVTIESWLQDLVYCLRTLRKNPGFAIVAVLTLTLGIGANATIFTLLDPILLRPLPYAEPDTLVRLYRTSAQSKSWPHSAPNFLDYRAMNQSFERLACFTWTSFNLSAPAEAPERAQGLAVSADFFPVFGVPSKLGNVFTDQDDRAESQPVIVLSHRFWVSRFGGDRNIIGRSVQLNGREGKLSALCPTTSRMLCCSIASICDVRSHSRMRIVKIAETTISIHPIVALRHE